MNAQLAALMELLGQRGTSPIGTPADPENAYGRLGGPQPHTGPLGVPCEVDRHDVCAFEGCVCLCHVRGTSGT
jgi:hypothetical protein